MEDSVEIKKQETPKNSGPSASDASVSSDDLILQRWQSIKDEFIGIQGPAKRACQHSYTRSEVQEIVEGQLRYVQLIGPPGKPGVCRNSDESIIDCLLHEYVRPGVFGREGEGDCHFEENFDEEIRRQIGSELCKYRGDKGEECKCDPDVEKTEFFRGLVKKFAETVEAPPGPTGKFCPLERLVREVVVEGLIHAKRGPKGISSRCLELSGAEKC